MSFHYFFVLGKLEAVRFSSSVPYPRFLVSPSILRLNVCPVPQTSPSIIEFRIIRSFGSKEYSKEMKIAEKNKVAPIFFLNDLRARKTEV